MVVRREREIRQFVKTPFYRVVAALSCENSPIEAEWRAIEGSKYWMSPALYKENGFKEREAAQKLIDELMGQSPVEAKVLSIEKKQEKKNPPLLFNLAELQNECSRLMKLSPDETLKVVQELYEKKLVTYPRTDARVLSTAVSKEITKNISGLKAIPGVRAFAEQILESGAYQGLAKTRYVNDKAITDHYAIIPTGQGIGQLSRLSTISVRVYEHIVRRFLSIFLPPAVYQKYGLEVQIGEEHFFANFKMLKEPGYLLVARPYLFQKKESPEEKNPENTEKDPEKDSADSEEEKGMDETLLEKLSRLKKGSVLPVTDMTIKEGETAPPKRYTSGSMILTMENAGQFIEDEDLRAQIKGSGIGTSATRAEILKKLVTNGYLALNQKTQIITPTLLGELIYDTVEHSLRQLLNPELTASWEKGLTYVAQGQITEQEYMGKLDDFIRRRTANVMGLQNARQLYVLYDQVKPYYPEAGTSSSGGRSAGAKRRTKAGSTTKAGNSK
jgi:DNA topoisomerase-3